jgi:Ca-activated chloride channel family protein
MSRTPFIAKDTKQTKTRRTCTQVCVVLFCVICVRFVKSAAQQVPVFRADVDLVNVAVTVTDRKGTLVTGLTRDDFDIYEDGRKQAIGYFATGDAAGAGPPLHLGLLLDVSESMAADMSFTKTASIRFLNTLTDAADVTVLDFDTEVRAARYSQREFARLIERIRQQKARGSTALYDAVGVYLDGAAGEDGRKIMLLYTDGGDTRSSLSFPELVGLLKASDVTIYPIGALEHQSSSSSHEQRIRLSQIAALTGGQAFFPTSVKELDAIYEKLLMEIRAQYTLGYFSSNEKTDGSWRRVDIKTPRHDLRVRSRPGYFARFVRSP